MNRCPSEHQWEAFVDGDLSPARRREFAAHCAACPRCRALVDELLALRTALAALPDPEPPASLEASVMAAVRAEPSPQPGAHRRTTALLTLFTAGVVAEVAAIVLAASGVTAQDFAGLIALRWPGLFNALAGAAGLIGALADALGSPRGWAVAVGILRQSPWLWPTSLALGLGFLLFARRYRAPKELS